MHDYRLGRHRGAKAPFLGRAPPHRPAPIDGRLFGRRAARPQGRSQTLAAVMPAPVATSANETDDAPSQDRWRNHAANNDGEPEEDFVDLHGS